MISIIISLHNEAKRFPGNFEKLYQVARSLHDSFEIILVDDGSTDDTQDLIRSLSEQNDHVQWIKLRKNLGQGAAIKLGILNSRGDYIVYMDADLSVSLDAIPTLLNFVKNGNDIAITSRWMPNSTITVRQPKLRQMLGKIYYVIIKLFFIQGIYDTNCGMKAYRGEAARFIFGFVRSWRWTFNLESLLLAQQFGYKVIEHPITWRNDPQSKVKIMRDVVMTAWELLMIKIRQSFGIYPQIEKQKRPR